MDGTTQEVYSEVYSILNLLGESFIKKLPTSLYEMIKKEKLDSYNPQYSPKLKLEEQDIKKESLSMIALFHLNYWCESEEEKEELKRIFSENEEKYQAELREKYNQDNIFKKKNVQPIQEEKVETNEVAMVEYKEKNIFKRFINKLFGFIMKIDKNNK